MTTQQTKRTHDAWGDPTEKRDPKAAPATETKKRTRDAWGDPIREARPNATQKETHR